MARSNSRFLKARYPIFAALLLITCIAALVVLRNFSIDNSVGIWFARDDPALAQYHEYLDRFGHTEWTLLMLETESLEAPAFWRDLQQLSARLARIAHVQRVVSLANVPGSSGQPRDAIRRLERSPLAKNLLLRPGDRRHTVVLLETTNDLNRQDPYRQAVIDAIHRAVARYPSITDHSVAGTSVINAELNRAARTDMFVFFTLVTVLVFIVALVLFRSLRDACVLLAVAAATVVFTMGLIALCGYAFNMVTIMLPAVLIALSVADVIHVVHVFHQIRSTDGAERAVGQTIRRVWLPCLGTSVTTMVGFLALAGSSVLPIFQLALFGCCGIALALVLSLVAAPLMLFHCWRDAAAASRRAPSGTPRYLRTLTRWLRRRPATIALTLVVSCAALVGLWRLRADTNYAEFFRSSSTVPRDYRKIAAAGFPQSTLALTLTAPATSRLSPAMWTSVHAFADALRRMPEVDYVLSALSLRQAGAASGARRTTDGDALGLVSRDRRSCQLVVLTRYLSSNELRQLIAAVRRVERGTVASGVALAITGTSVLWANMDRHIIHTQIWSAAVVSGALFVVLTLIFGSWSLALIGWIVSAVPVALILGVMGLFGVQINMATVLIAGIALGIAVDDTIHFVFAFRRRSSEGGDAAVALEQTLLDVGHRMVITSAIIVGGFASMTSSSFMPTATFGLFSCLTVAVALLFDLFGLPLALGLWARAAMGREARRRQRSHTKAPRPLAIETRRA